MSERTLVAPCAFALLPECARLGADERLVGRLVRRQRSPARRVALAALAELEDLGFVRGVAHDAGDVPGAIEEERR